MFRLFPWLFKVEFSVEEPKISSISFINLFFRVVTSPITNERSDEFRNLNSIDNCISQNNVRIILKPFLLKCLYLFIVQINLMARRSINSAFLFDMKEFETTVSSSLFKNCFPVLEVQALLNWPLTCAVGFV